MRNNQPVYDKETPLHDEQYLISRTDARGRIIYANPAFVEISGFTREELIGAAHNIVRHPDMPGEAYADLWRTVERGESWTSVVKNRRKDGGYFWVLATVTPIIERGVTVCYASVRVKPSRAQIDAAERLYAQLRAGTARGLRLHRGQPRRTGIAGRLARVAQWRPRSVRSRVLAWTALSASLFLGAAGAALYAMSDRLASDELGIAAAGLAAGVMLIVASGWNLARTITRPLATATRFTRQIAAGNLTTPLPAAGVDDDIDALMFSLETMRKSLVCMARDVHHGGAQRRHAIEAFRVAASPAHLPNDAAAAPVPAISAVSAESAATSKSAAQATAPDSHLSLKLP